MPFGNTDQERATYKSIGEHFKRKLDENGFDARRADEIPGSQLILQDIVRDIEHSGLIVADLTGNNPNVLFELAIAYSLDKAVVLLTQGSFDDLPFDLRHYRVVQYSRDFDKMVLAEKALQLGASAFLNGDRAYFGNPVAAYFNRQVGVASDIDDDAADLGLYDYFEQIEVGWQSIRQTIEALLENQQQVTQAIKTATQRLNKLQETRPRLQVMRKIASELEASAALIDEKSKLYQDELDRQEIAVEAVMQQVDLGDQENLEAYKDLLATLAGVEENIQEASDGISEYRSSLQSAPSIERRFNRARASLVASLSALLDSFERHRLMLSRIREIGKQRLDHSGS